MTDDKKGSSINGSGGNDKSGPKKIVHFPTLAERDRIRKEKIAEELKDRKMNKTGGVPFINFKKIPAFTGFLVISFSVINILIHLFFTDAQKLETFYALGFVPSYFSGGAFPWYAPLGIFTHVFIHGGWMHFFFNTIMALTLGLMFEKTYGTRAAIIFFFLCVFAALFLYFILNLGSGAPLIGASGGLSGMFGAALILIHQRGQIRFPNKFGPWPAVGFWAVFMVLMGYISGDNGAWPAHLGGFLFGVFLLLAMQKRNVKIINRIFEEN
jgi:membrane associated rhomboid family serine protease